jgi:ankyrin
MSSERARQLRNACTAQAMHELLSASAADAEGLVRDALAKGLDKNVSIQGGATFLHVASMSDNVGVARALIEAGAYVDARSDDGVTPLHVCCKYDAFRVAHALIEAGEDIHVDEAQTTWGGPLHVAAWYGSPRVARELLEAGAPVEAPLDFDLKGAFLIAGATPLHCAASSSSEGSVAVAGLLLAAGADKDAQDDLGGTPLHVCSRSGNVGVATILLEAGADANIRDDDGRTPLECCSAAHGVAELLVVEGLRKVTEV